MSAYVSASSDAAKHRATALRYRQRCETVVVRLREPGEEGRLWDWPNWTGPAAGALLGASVAARVDDKTVGVLGGLAIFVFATGSAFLAKRRTNAPTPPAGSDADGVAQRHR